jgi:thiosulfate/3-mercaptopyruvate sulfurtransferase
LTSSSQEFTIYCDKIPIRTQLQGNLMYTTIIDVDTLYNHLSDPTWAVVDCRFRLDNPNAGRDLYVESHIPGAVYAHTDDDLAGLPAEDTGRHPLPDLDTFRDTLGGWGIGKDTQVVVYDDLGGAYAARLWWMLRYLGHSAVALLDGGWKAWMAAGHPTRSGEEQPAPAHFTGEPNPAMIATMAEVEQLVAQGKGNLLIDSRDPKRYRGEHEPIDPVAGHIPGAKNHFLGNNIERNQRFRTAADLRATFDELLGEQSPTDTIVYCGSGVTACQNLLAMSIARLEGARLFIPSWSGWVSNPNRPIETTDG